MKEYSNGIKGAAVVIHQLCLVLMVCGLYGIGYNMRMHYNGLGLLSTLTIFGLVGSFVMLAFLTGITGRRSRTISISILVAWTRSIRMWNL